MDAGKYCTHNSIITKENVLKIKIRAASFWFDCSVISAVGGCMHIQYGGCIPVNRQGCNSVQTATSAGDRYCCCWSQREIQQLFYCVTFYCRGLRPAAFLSLLGLYMIFFDRKLLEIKALTSLSKSSLDINRLLCLAGPKRTSSRLWWSPGAPWGWPFCFVFSKVSP